MMKFLLLKTGSTFTDTVRTMGDYEDWIIASTSVPRSQWQVIDCRSAPKLPVPDQFKAIIISGSHDNVTDNLPWMKNTQKWLKQADTLNIPILGICFGHQILAATFGGEVNFTPDGIEIGTHIIHLTAAAKRDPLFHGLPDQFAVNESHAQAVLALPENACLLAGNAHTAIQAMVLNDHIWGLQFHPEFGKAQTQVYFETDKKYLTDKQISETQIEDTPLSRSLLQRFIDLVNSDWLQQNHNEQSTPR